MTAEEKLLKSYKKTQKELEKKLSAATSGTMRLYYRKLLKEIEKAIEKLKRSAAEYAALAVPAQYMQNAAEIQEQFTSLSLSMKPPTAFKRQHSDAIHDMQLEVQAQLEQGIAKAGEQAAALVEQARRQAQPVPDTQEVERQLIADAAEESNLRRLGLEAAQFKIDTGGTVLDMQHEMSRLLEKEGILKVETGSGDKKRTMSITDYSALVARSTSREVGNTARINQMVLNGFDLVEIPPHYPTCEVCAILQNRVYSISGKDKRFPPLSRAIGIYKNIHPNCRHVIVGWAEEAYTPQEIEEAIRRSNRSWEDPRTGEEIQLYNSIQRKLRLSRDMRAQYDRYKKRLGDDAPKSFYAFKRLKNAGGDKWKELQEKYRASGVDKSKKYATLKDIKLASIPITKDSIFNVKMVDTITLDKRGNLLLQRAHKNLLRFIRKEPMGTEAIAYYDLEMNMIVRNVGQMFYVDSQNITTPHIIMHNHPSGYMLTDTDIISFLKDTNGFVLSAVGNDGSIYVLEKTASLDLTGFVNSIAKARSNNPQYMSAPEFYIEYMNEILKGAGSYGFNYIESKVKGT